MKAEGPLLDLAASVADGTDVDWLAAESGAEGGDRRLVRHLRLVADVAELYRSLPEARAGVTSEPADERAPDGPRWGRLVLLEKIGEGTSSEVYRAWDPELQREVALKLLRADGSEAEAARWRMLGEARRLARVRHPHVVLVFGADRRDDRVGLWMESVDGATLDDIVRRSGAFGAREAALVGLDLCGALAAVHAAGLVHRDIKAQNVMRETGGRIVLMDFGTGEDIKQASGAQLVGTPLYFAPEIFARKPASAASDLYSLGVLLFYLVTGQFPIAASTFGDLARAHQRREGRRLRDLRPDLPEPFVRVVECALSHDPNLRYESAGGMEAALRQALDRTPVEAVAAPQRTRMMWPWIAAAVIAAVALTVTVTRQAPDGPASAPAALSAPLTQIAVLPLADLSGGSAPPYLADGLTDQLIGTLGQVRALRVTARTSVLRFKDGTTPVRDIAKALNVGSVLEGSVNVGAPDASGERTVTVNTRLIAAGTDSQLWAETFQRSLGDALALESEIARAVARAVRVVLSPAEAARLERGQTKNQAAAEAYFQGRYHLNQFGTANFRRAIAAFERATKLDANYALAHAGLARAYVNLGSAGSISTANARTSALASVSRALALDDTLAEAHAGMADIKFLHDWDWQAAEAAYRRAIDLSPSFSYARTQLARLMSAQGRLKLSVEEARRAEQLDPLSAEVAQSVGLLLYYARDYEAATKQLSRALELDPDLARAHLTLSRVHEARAEWKQAIASAERALALAGGAEVVWQAHLARLRALSGDRAGARRQLRQFEASNQSGATYLAPEHLAYLHAALGDEDRAMALLERAVAERDLGILWLKVDPRLDRFRKLPQFQELVRRVGLDPSVP